MFAARVAAVTLVAFDGSPGVVSKFVQLNDPVMGGKSTGTWSVSTCAGAPCGVFDGEVADVPSLQAPGFIKAAADGRFPDAASAMGGSLVLEVRSSTPEYAGFRVTFAAGTLSPAYACGGGGSLPLSRGCYKASFAVPAGDDFTKVRVPLTHFSDLWSPATGDATKTCAEDKSACPTARELAKILRLELWAEGKLGKAHLEVKSVAAEAASPAPESPVVLAADACSFYRKVQDGECADACLNDRVGICPVSIIAKTGGLETGACKDAGYTVADGSVDQNAGPCGKLHFDKYKKAASPVVLAADACSFYRKVQDGECADACLNDRVGICPVSIIAKTGGLETGACKDAGYTVADGSVDQNAGPCGKLHFDKYKKATADAVLV